MSNEVREVIARGEVKKCSSSNCRYLHVDGQREQVSDLWVISDCPVGTKVEVVALVKPEKKLIRPEGAVWRQDFTCPTGSVDVLIDSKGNVIARVVKNDFNCRSRYGWGTKPLNGTSDGREAGQQAAEHALADAGLYGFSWRTEPEYCGWITTFKRGNTWPSEYWPLEADALGDYNHEVQQDSPVKLYGVTENGDHVLLDQWPKGEDQNEIPNSNN